MVSHKLYQGDNLRWLREIRGSRVDCIFADPPDNIGLGYSECDDKLDYAEYVDLLWEWLTACCAVANTVWISFNSKWVLEFAKIVDQLKVIGDLEFKPCVQTFSFYQYNKNDLANAHRLLWRLRRPGAPLYPEHIKIPSWRQLNGDPRAAEGGKVPGDAFDFTKLPEKQRRDWHERAIEVGGYIVDPLIPDDHFDFTRVVGNSKQRRPYHPTQLNEGLVERCILLSTKPGDLVLDPFAGTGTTLRVCKKIGRRCTLIELDPMYCEKIAEEHELEILK